jgi:hypothetical protein
MEHTPIGDTTMKTIITGLALLTTLSLVSCGPKPQEDSKAAGFDKVGVSTNETENLLSMVKQDLISHGVKEASLDFSKIGTVGVGNLDDNTGGVCYTDSKNIVLNKKKFSDGSYDIYDKKEVLAHEIGHCLFGLDHDDKNFNLMNTHKPVISNTMYQDLIKDFANKLISLGY